MITHPMQTASDFIKGIVGNIKGFFNFKISWPHIPLPHFGITPRGWNVGDLLKGKIPTLGIQWFKKAYDEPMELNGPTAFGVQNGKVLAGGEGDGPEYISGKEGIKQALREVLNELKIGVYLDGDTLVGELIERIDKLLFKRGMKGARGV